MKYKPATDIELYQVWVKIKEVMKKKARQNGDTVNDRSFSYRLPDNVDSDELMFYAEKIDQQFFNDNPMVLFIYDEETHSLNVLWK